MCEGGEGVVKGRVKSIAGSGIACATAQMVIVLWENSRWLGYRWGRPINWMQAAGFQCMRSRTRREPCKPYLGFGWLWASGRGIFSRKVMTGYVLWNDYNFL